MTGRLLWAMAVLAPYALLFMLAEDPWAEVAALWLVTPMAFFAAAFANATAVGGGFLFIPFFIFGHGLDPLTALKLSLGTQAFGMSSGALGWSHAHMSRRALVTGCAGALLGMAVGTLFWVPSGSQVKWVFGWVSVLVGVAMYLEFRYGRHTGATTITRTGPVDETAYFLACVAGGLITAWVSFGIGEVIALWLLFRHRLRIETAIGTGVAALAACSILGFLVHAGLREAAFPWTYMAFTVPGVLLGGYAGARGGRIVEDLMRSRGLKSPLKAVFATVVFLDGLVMLLAIGATS